MRPGTAWMRENWGMSHSPEWNQHPDRDLPKLHENVPTEEVWLRVEHQALVRLPETRAILFGIRIAVHPLSRVGQDRPLTERLLAELEEMPEDLARYKNLATSRKIITQHLRNYLNG